VGYRCLSRSKLLEYNCNETDIYENKPILDVLQDKPLKDYESSDQAVQVTPQRAKLTLVKGVCCSLFYLVILSNVCHYEASPLSHALTRCISFLYQVCHSFISLPLLRVCFADLFHIIFKHFVLCPRFAYQHFVVVTSFCCYCYCIWRGNTSISLPFFSLPPCLSISSLNPLYK